jgi:hypothetical protein
VVLAIEQHVPVNGFTIALVVARAPTGSERVLAEGTHWGAPVPPVTNQLSPVC